jgi:hypothetical protein
MDINTLAWRRLSSSSIRTQKIAVKRRSPWIVHYGSLRKPGVTSFNKSVHFTISQPSIFYQEAGNPDQPCERPR